MSSKTCTKCSESKTVEEFGRDKRSRGGRQSCCKVCDRERNTRYRAENADKVRQKDYRWRAENPEYAREYAARYRAENADNPDFRAKERERHTRYRAENPEQAARYRAENPDRIAANSARRRARKASVRSEPYDRTELFERWGYTCCYCDAPAEHVEHITPISKGGDDVLSNVTVACATCNSSKGSKSLAQWAIDSLDLK